MTEIWLRYGLVVVATIGMVECVRVFRTVILDKRALDAQGVNGGRKLVVDTLWGQNAFLLAAFAVLIGMGIRVAFASPIEMTVPLIRTFVSLMDLLAVLLMLKEWMILRGRERQDDYYEYQLRHTHRRKGDKPISGIIPRKDI